MGASQSATEYSLDGFVVDPEKLVEMVILQVTQEDLRNPEDSGIIKFELNTLMTYWATAWYNVPGKLPGSENYINEKSVISIYMHAFEHVGLPGVWGISQIPPTFVSGATSFTEFYNLDTGHRVYTIGDTHVPSSPTDCNLGNIGTSTPDMSSAISARSARSARSAMSVTDYILQQLRANHFPKVSIILEQDMNQVVVTDIHKAWKHDQIGLNEMYQKLLPCFTPRLKELQVFRNENFPGPCQNLKGFLLDARVGFFTNKTQDGIEGHRLMCFLLKTYELQNSIQGMNRPGFRPVLSPRRLEHWASAAFLKRMWEVFNFSFSVSGEDGLLHVDIPKCVDVLLGAYHNSSVYADQHTSKTLLGMIESIPRDLYLGNTDILLYQYYLNLNKSALDYFHQQLMESCQYLESSLIALQTYLINVDLNCPTIRRQHRRAPEGCLAGRWDYALHTKKLASDVNNSFDVACDIMDLAVIHQVIKDSIDGRTSIIYAGDYHNETYANFLRLQGYSMIRGTRGVRTKNVDETKEDHWCLHLSRSFGGLNLHSNIRNIKIDKRQRDPSLGKFEKPIKKQRLRDELTESDSDSSLTDSDSSLTDSDSSLTESEPRSGDEHR